MKTKAAIVRKLLNYVAVVLIILVLWNVALGPTLSHGPVFQNTAMISARNIGLCLNQYSLDHNGHYPEGKTSTEIFQQLVDEHYVTDPRIFYFNYGWIRVLGKVPPESNHLNAENVSFDVTCCVDSSSSDKLPLVFLTGYKVTYQPGSSAKPCSPFAVPPPRTWREWFNGTPYSSQKFIAVSYKDDSARSIRAGDDGSIPNFIPADFDPKGKTYRQLTP